MSVKEREYVQAARFMGLSAPKTIVRHMLPNISSLLIIDATLNVSAAILAETGLSFFGFGVQSPDTSLGTLLGEGARQVNSFPWLFVSPAVAVVAPGPLRQRRRRRPARRPRPELGLRRDRPMSTSPTTPARFREDPPDHVRHGARACRTCT